MDVLRSCYRAQMRMYQGEDISTPVEWYFVPDDRELIPWDHAFGSRIYDRDEEPQLELGERYAPVPWRGGAVTWVVPTGGLCGDKERWQKGASISDPLPDPWPNTNVARCCKQPPNVGFGGRALGGFGIISCCCDDLPLPENVSVVFVLQAGFCPALDGIPFVMHPPTDPVPPWLPPVQWESDFFDFGDGLKRFYLFCTPETCWLMYLVDPSISDSGMIAADFSVESCLPFLLSSPEFTIQWPVILPACDMLFASVEVSPL